MGGKQCVTGTIYSIWVQTVKQGLFNRNYSTVGKGVPLSLENKKQAHQTGTVLP